LDGVQRETKLRERHKFDFEKFANANILGRYDAASRRLRTGMNNTYLP